MNEEDDLSTQLITKIPWHPPVKSVDDLPTTGIKNKTMCFVEEDGEEEVWQIIDGRWIRIDML